MKHLIWMAAILILSTTPGFSGEPGEAIFESLKCDICHKPDTWKTNPSLKTLSQAYGEDRDRLVQYLKGEADPLVDSGKAAIMKRYIKKTRNLSDADRSNLARYILSFSLDSK